jgi:hypothetical protein
MSLPASKPDASSSFPPPASSVTRVRRDSFLPLPAPPSALGQVTMVRSTLLATSLQSLRARGMLDRYTRHVAGPHTETILTAVAGAWLPVDAAIAHYRACDALGLEPSEEVAIGMEVGDRVHGTFLGLMVRTAKTLGVTPWLALAQSAKLNSRLFSGGGGIAVSELGPKEARVDVVGNPLCDVEYFRNGLRGVYQAAVRLFCQRVYSSEIPRGLVRSGMTLRVSWV